MTVGDVEWLKASFRWSPEHRCALARRIGRRASADLPSTYTFSFVKLAEKERHKSVHITLPLVFALVMTNGLIAKIYCYR